MSPPSLPTSTDLVEIRNYHSTAVKRVTCTYRREEINIMIRNVHAREGGDGIASPRPLPVPSLNDAAHVFANVTFTEDFTTHGVRTGMPEIFKAGDTIQPLQLHHDPHVTTIDDPDAMWTSEAESGVCGDWIYIPGRVLHVDPDSVTSYPA